MLGPLLAFAPPASGWEAALTWLSLPQEPQLRLLLALCAAAALGGLGERTLTGRPAKGAPPENSEPPPREPT